MLTEIAPGVWVHESEFLQSNSVVVQGQEGVLLIDPGITRADLACLADDLSELGQSVVAGFSTHPDWDHVLWQESFGDVPRYGTALNAASIREVLTHENWMEEVAEALPPEHAEDIPIDLFGRIDGLPAGTTEVPWTGPVVRLIEHRAHAVGHAGLVIDGTGVLVAGDMLSDILIPFLDLAAAQPLEDYLAALQLFEDVSAEVNVVVPGHGSVAAGEEIAARIALDRRYVRTLRDGGVPDDPRVGPDAPLDWLGDVNEWQLAQLAQRTGSGAAPE